MNTSLWFKDHSGSVELSIYCQPRASKTEVVGVHGEFLKVRIAASPIAGEANTELCHFLAKTFHVKRHEVEVVSGKTSRKKQVLILGKTAHTIMQSFPQERKT